MENNKYQGWLWMKRFFKWEKVFCVLTNFELQIRPFQSSPPKTTHDFKKITFKVETEPSTNRKFKIVLEHECIEFETDSASLKHKWLSKFVALVEKKKA